MKTNEVKLIFPRVFLIALFIFSLNVGFIIYQNKEAIDFSNKSITGNAINLINSKNLQGISRTAKIFFIAQWSIIILMLLTAKVKDRTTKVESKEIKEIHIKNNKQKTDLDLLYNLLLKKTQIKISVISKAFNIKKEIAMEWCKILESGDLAIIDYPMFGGPIIRINKKNQNEASKQNETKIVKEKTQELKKDYTFKKRNIFLIYLLSLLTLGIYYVYWIVSTRDEMGSQGIKIPTGWLIFIPLVNLVWLYLYIKGFTKIKQSQNTILLFLLILLTGAILTPIIIQPTLNKYSKKTLIKKEKQLKKIIKKPHQKIKKEEKPIKKITKKKQSKKK